MIYGVGVDLVEINRIEKAIQRWGQRFVGRVFTPGEIEICCARPTSSGAFALRFAAKEAFSKALGMGMRRGVKWRDIEVFNYPSGKPSLRLYGISSEICSSEGITGIHLSLTDEGKYGVAMVVLEKERSVELKNRAEWS